MNDADVDRLLKRAARFLRRRTPPDLDSDDLVQIAALALLEAKAAGRSPPPGSDRRHTENIVRKKAVWAMLDGIRTSFSQRPSGTTSIDDRDEDDGPAHEQAAPDDPQRIAQLRQAIARLERKGSPQLLRCARLLASGMPAVEVAAEMGMCGSRISQLRADARELMDPCL